VIYFGLYFKGWAETMGREFLTIFDDWAENYDDTVSGLDPEYSRVFAKYEEILEAVVHHTKGPVLEFGPGTGNLAKKIIAAGYEYIGIEPSKAMREKFRKKLPKVSLYDGDFLRYPVFSIPIQTIVSTYAFHHLTNEEKETAVKKFSKTLSDNGRIVFADTMFRSEKERLNEVARAKKQGYTTLAEDLEREYYPTITFLKQLFKRNNFTIEMHQMNDFVWLLVAEKKSE
jgi:putative AdoMet-dependent methyltransferase